MDEIGNAASSTLSEEARTFPNKLVKDMNSLCFFYYMNFRSVADVHEGSVGTDQCERVDFSLADLSYTVRKNRNDHHEEYDVLDSSDM